MSLSFSLCSFKSSMELPFSLYFSSFHYSICVKQPDRKKGKLIMMMMLNQNQLITTFHCISIPSIAILFHYYHCFAFLTTLLWEFFSFFISFTFYFFYNVQIYSFFFCFFNSYIFFAHTHSYLS